MLWSVVRYRGISQTPAELTLTKSIRRGWPTTSGVVGHYLNGHLNESLSIYLEELEGRKSSNQDGATDHVYVPRYNQLFGKTDYIGGWGFQVNYSSYMFPSPGNTAGQVMASAFKEQVRTMQSGIFMLLEAGARSHPITATTCTPSTPAMLDAHGIPTPVVHFRFSEE